MSRGTAERLPTGCRLSRMLCAFCSSLHDCKNLLPPTPARTSCGFPPATQPLPCLWLDSRSVRVFHPFFLAFLLMPPFLNHADLDELLLSRDDLSDSQLKLLRTIKAKIRDFPQRFDREGQHY